ncbi:unnamed protein product [Candidula unifasciata]|uniref:Proteasome assembly chaperone 3 n=1 Tax=Candidula unifasciata TaxID=100452 RepID=A0A8S3ZP90_9EUPU|nr:unnamed protein product [Candidula unifasciata]
MAAPSDSSSRRSIVPYKQAADEVLGHHTEVVVNKFEDHLFVIVTQYMKIGTVVEVRRELISDEVQGDIPEFSTKVLLGKDEPITHVVAKKIVTEINPPIPVILTLALKDTSLETAEAVIRLIKLCL